MNRKATLRAGAGVIAVLAFLMLAFPILSFPIRADDAYWILNEPAGAGNSIIAAYWNALAGAYEFDGQPRTTALATAERVALHILVMEFATEFAVPPFVPWALTKVAWLIAGLGALWIFLRRFTYRDESGVIRSFDGRTIRALLTVVPVLTVTMLELETSGFTNGWIFYPNLTYLPFAYYLLIAVALIEAESLLRRRFFPWFIPVSVGVISLAWIVSLSYELVALAIPFGIAVLLLKPAEGGGNFLFRNRAKIVIAGVFGGAYTIIFLWTRWQINQMPCQADGSCYTGTVVQFDPGTILRNLTSGLPGAGVDWIMSGDAGALPVGRVATGVGIVALLLVSAIVLLQSRPLLTVPNGIGSSHSSGSTRRGLLILAGLMIAVAFGSAVITGITVRAVEGLVEPISPYRSGVIIALALSVAATALGLLAWRALFDKRALRVSAALILSLAVIALGSSNFLMNLSVKPVELSSQNSVTLDRIHYEVALGNTRAWADEERCELLVDYWNSWANPGSTAREIVEGAQVAFRFYHQTPFCSEGSPAEE